MISRLTTIAAGSIVVAGSIILALGIQRPYVRCSYGAGTTPPRCLQPTGDLAALRAGIIGAGFVIAVLILIGGHMWRNRHDRKRG